MHRNRHKIYPVCKQYFCYQAGKRGKDTLWRVCTRKFLHPPTMTSIFCFREHFDFCFFNEYHFFLLLSYSASPPCFKFCFVLFCFIYFHFLSSYSASPLSITFFIFILFDETRSITCKLLLFEFLTV